MCRICFAWVVGSGAGDSQGVMIYREGDERTWIDDEVLYPKYFFLITAYLCIDT